jgi:hypothetical protein
MKEELTLVMATASLILLQQHNEISAKKPQTPHMA